MERAIFQQPVEGYLARLAISSPPPHPVMEEMRVHGTKRNFPIVGPEVGRFFLQLAAIRRPRRILELGSGFGYSAAWWAMGCPNSEIHLTDFDAKNLAEAKSFCQRLGILDRLVMHEGDALEIGKNLDGPWDIIFCDIDKKDYPKAVDLANEVQRPGDLLLFDNMLRHGEVAAPESEWNDPTRGVIETTRKLYNDPAWAVSLLPVRDGVSMALRVG